MFSAARAVAGRVTAFVAAVEVVAVVRGALPWWVDGVVNLVDVGDVARAHVAAARPTPSDRYCLGGHDVRIRWLLRHIAERYGGRAPDRELSADEARARADADERRELVDLVTTGQPVSSARARAELGTELSPLDDSLDRAHAWFVRHSYVPRAPQKEMTDESA